MAYPTNPIYKFYKHPMTGDNAGSFALTMNLGFGF